MLVYSYRNRALFFFVTPGEKNNFQWDCLEEFYKLWLKLSKYNHFIDAIHLILNKVLMQRMSWLFFFVMKFNSKVKEMRRFECHFSDIWLQTHYIHKHNILNTLCFWCVLCIIITLHKSVGDKDHLWQVDLSKILVYFNSGNMGWMCSCV